MRSLAITSTALAVFIGCAGTPPPASSSPPGPVRAPAADPDIVVTGECPTLAIYLSELAGADAYECGAVQPDDPSERRAAVIACVRDAHERGRPFQASFFSRGKDSMLGTAWTRNAAGEIHRVLYDRNPKGGHVERPTMTRYRCEGAQLTAAASPSDSPRLLFTCASSAKPAERCRTSR